MKKYFCLAVLLLFCLFSCQAGSSRFSRDSEGNLIIPTENYRLYKKHSACRFIEGKFLEVERNRYKNETELNDMLVFLKDGSVQVYLTNEVGIPKFDRFYEGMYCIENDTLFIEFFYPTHGGSKRYTSIMHKGTFTNDKLSLTWFKDIITLKKIE